MKHRFHLLTLIILLALSRSSFSQTGPWTPWEAGVVSELNTADDARYLSEEEQNVILFMNMARHDGPLFAETFLSTYVHDKQLQNSSYIRSLINDLSLIEGYTPLLPAEDLSSVARGHATKSGKNGSTGHKGFKKRFAPLMGKPYTQVGENCSYGYQEAIDIVVSLLIDEGIKSLGHRKNILSRDYNSVGVSIRPHKSYGVNCVMDFGHKD